MTKKHFEIVALLLGKTLAHSPQPWRYAVEEACRVLRQTNANFDAGRFTEAVDAIASGNRPSGFSKALWEEYAPKTAI
jgi:hypothetical protein